MHFYDSYSNKSDDNIKKLSTQSGSFLNGTRWRFSTDESMKFGWSRWWKLMDVRAILLPGDKRGGREGTTCAVKLTFQPDI